MGGPRGGRPHSGVKCGGQEGRGLPDKTCKVVTREAEIGQSEGGGKPAECGDSKANVSESDDQRSQVT